MGKSKIYLHLVGEGKELAKYKELVEKYNLSEYVTFYGTLSGKELDAVFDTADIAACSLGCHRIHIFSGSFLKSREYLARGLPIFSSTKIDVVPDKYPYCLYVPEDETPVDVNKIVEFFDEITADSDTQKIHNEIRSFAKENCGISSAMKEVGNFILERA